jgi:hypothetical protein
MEKDLKLRNLLYFVTWNVWDICHKEDQIEDNLIKKNIHTAVISETIRKHRCTKETNHYTNIQSDINLKTRP